MQWRHWWIGAIKDSFPEVFGDVVLIQNLVPLFVDQTIDRNEFMADITSYCLNRLINGADKHLRADVLCPWGGNEFLHRCGLLDGALSFSFIINF